MSKELTSIKMNENRVFIDTNVLINCILGDRENLRCVQYLSTLQGKSICISSLSVAQTVALLQKHKSRLDLDSIVNKLLVKFKILSFTEDDIKKSISISQTNDYEDKMQYAVCCKGKCFYIVTNNTKDYNRLLNVRTISPAKIRTINN